MSLIRVSTGVEDGEMKNQTILQTSVNRDTLTIRGANQGQYWCRGQRDERPKSSQKSNRINLIINGE